MTVKPAAGLSPEAEIPVLIIGGGAAGLCAALAAHEAGADCAILERDAVSRGSTALSAGLIPAAGTRFQLERGIADDATIFAGDILRKAKGEPDAALVERVTRGCPALPADVCIPLGNIRLPSGEDPPKASDIDISPRPIVYSNDLLFDLFLALGGDAAPRNRGGKQ